MRADALGRRRVGLCHSESFRDALCILPSAHPRANRVQYFTQEDLDAFADMSGEIAKRVLCIPPISHISFKIARLRCASTRQANATPGSPGSQQGKPTFRRPHALGRRTAFCGDQPQSNEVLRAISLGLSTRANPLESGPIRVRRNIPANC